MNGEFGVDHFDRHLAVEGQISGQEDDTHPPLPQRPLQAVMGPEGGLKAVLELSDVDGHGVSRRYFSDAQDDGMVAVCTSSARFRPRGGLMDR